MLRRQRDSSWARAPLRTPPPGRRGEAIFRTAILGFLVGVEVRMEWAAAKVSDLMTWILGGVDEGAGAGDGAS